MPQVSMQEGVERAHAPLATTAGVMLARQSGWRNIFLCDAAAPLPACRTDDLVILLQRGGTSRIDREGGNRVSLTYTDASCDLALPALLAAAAPPQAPVMHDPESLAVLGVAERIAATEIPVLIGGPTGAGKEVASRFIHRASGRAGGPFVAVNCAAMPDTMLEAMLFGHRKGAFTGAADAGEGFFRAADGGTLLLDEIAEMPLGLQAKLLRALQEGEVVPLGATKPVKVDVRIIACANRVLTQEVAEGRFREDLYYRLNVFPLHLPALRERPADVAPLAFAMLLRHRPASGPRWISEAAIARLRTHAWPGNVRELENVIRRALVFAEGSSAIAAEHVVFDDTARMLDASVVARPGSLPADPGNEHGRLAHLVRQQEVKAIAAALVQTGGNRQRTARALGISERTLRYRLAKMREQGLAVAGGGR